jgi:transmembrane sensor
MNLALVSNEEARRETAAGWLVRLGAPDLDAAELGDFDAWLAEPANANAYDAALAVTLELQAAAPAILRDLKAKTARRPMVGRPSVGRRGWLVAGGLAAAATVALAITPFSFLAPAAQAFATVKGEHRTVRLADGSTIDLNAGSTLSVSLGAHERRVSMGDGEAVFDVAHDATRPFLIAVGDRTVRVIGTRFDVRRREGKLSVAVERGLVEVDPADGARGRGFRLQPGQRLDHVEGAADVRLSAVDPAQIESWKAGRLIYRDAPLADVVADLNQQFAKPITLSDPALGAVPVSGVLVLDDQAAVIRRLALLAPIKALPSEQGVLLRRDEAAKP